jgi:hypothetical protein
VLAESRPLPRVVMSPRSPKGTALRIRVGSLVEPNPQRIDSALLSVHPKDSQVARHSDQTRLPGGAGSMSGIPLKAAAPSRATQGW